VSLNIVQVNFGVESVNCFSTLFRCLHNNKFTGQPAAAAPTLYNFSSDMNRKYFGKKVDLITKQRELLHFNKRE
jgi:hypothetical protein